MGRQFSRQCRAFHVFGLGVCVALAWWYFRMYFPVALGASHLLVSGLTLVRVMYYVLPCTLLARPASASFVSFLLSRLYLLVSSSAIFFILFSLSLAPPRGGTLVSPGNGLGDSLHSCEGGHSSPSLSYPPV